MLHRFLFTLTNNTDIVMCDGGGSSVILSYSEAASNLPVPPYLGLVLNTSILIIRSHRPPPIRTTKPTECDGCHPFIHYC